MKKQIKEVVGNYIVEPTPNAVAKGVSLCDSHPREIWRLRRHAFKLAYWPTGPNGDFGEPDIDYYDLKALRAHRISALRIDEKINGFNNVRVIFFRSNTPIYGEPLPRIWLLDTFQKKSRRYTPHQQKALLAVKKLICIRHYNGDQNA